jgi:Spy/CpxP family protein refolding chaperone
MPIRFDRYPVPEGGLNSSPGVRGGYRVPAPDTTLADTAAQVAKIGQIVSKKMFDAAEAQDALKQKVLVGERFLTAKEEMDRQIIAIEQQPELREKAEDHFGKWMQTRSKDWSKGLTAEGAAALEEKLAESRYTNGHRARMIQVKDLQARTDTVILGHAKAFVDDFVRSGPELVEMEIGEDGAPRPKETRTFRDLKEAYGHAVASNAKTRDGAAKALVEIRQEAAAAKAHAMILGDGGSLMRLKDLVAMEKAQPGTTFLGVLDAKTVNAIEKQAKDESYTMLTRQQEQIERRRKELDRHLTEQREDWERRSDTMLRDGTLTAAWIEDGKKLNLATSEKAAFYRTALEQRASGEQGPNDEATFRRLAPQVWSATSDPRKVLAEVQSAFEGRRLNYQTAISSWSAHLESRIERDKTRGASPEERALKDERGDIEKLIGVLTTTRSPFEKFDPAANRLKLQLLEELSRLPQDQSAKEWYFKNQNRFYGQMRGLASGYIRTERSAMLKADYQTVEDIAANKQSYVSKYGADWRARMVEDVERMQRITDLQADIDAKNPGGTPGPKPGAAAENKPASSAKPAEKKPSGPLKSGSRSY